MTTLTQVTRATLIGVVVVIVSTDLAILLLARLLAAETSTGRLAWPGPVIGRISGAGTGNPAVAAVMTGNRPAGIRPHRLA